MRLQAQSTDRRDRESRLKAFHAFLIKGRKMLEFETDTEKNVQNHKNNLPEFYKEAALARRDIARTESNSPIS